MQDPLARLKAATADLERRDAKLRAELREHRQAARVTAEGQPGGGASELVVEGQRLDSAEFAQETIVLRTGRPVLAIQRGQLQPIEEPDSVVWRQRLAEASARLLVVADRVGRIEVKGHPLAWLGTGWLVDHDIVVTNRHVAGAFARLRGDTFVFRQGILGETMSASINFSEELEWQATREVRLQQVLYIEDDDGPDLAFLKMATTSQAGEPLMLAAVAPEENETVAVIGYPARDSRIPDTALMDRIFGNKYDAKRLAPGLVTGGDRRRLLHDCTTLGGNSGSVLVSLGTGQAVGLHFAGRFLTANFAVPSQLVRERLEQVKRGNGPRRVAPPAAGPERAVAAPPVSVTPAMSSTSFVVPVRITIDIGAPDFAPKTPAPDTAVARPTGREKGGRGRRTDLAAFSEPIEWNEQVFSRSLAEALDRHDHNQAQTLMEVFSQHVEGRPYPYAPVHANGDLSALRRKRQFSLMRRYAEAVLASGTTDLQVRRQYGQALIEQGEFQQAREVLEAVNRESWRNPKEGFEARGLIGRSYKQQYVDRPSAPGAPDGLKAAITAYRSVYDEDPNCLWHGINAVSCSLRAHREGFAWADLQRARQSAQAILDRIAALPQTTGRLHVWDEATRVEALLALDRYDEAEAAIGSYLGHPDLDAFEVSSTHRQFAQVLQIDLDDRGKGILDRLREAVERYRTGGSAAKADMPADGTPATVPILVRVSDPTWTAGGVPDLVVHGRLGTVIAAEGSRRSLESLLRDPAVITVDESRPAGTLDCGRSVPFIHVAETYPGAGGPYVEKGDRALIAVVDNGIDVLHEAFLDASGRSRIVGIWDQRDASGPPPPGFDFGTYYSGEQVAGFVAGRALPDKLDRNVDGHGTHVASIAAGRAAGAFRGGVAPEARLLIVISDGRDPIGYSRTHVAALDFIDRHATALGLPVVVNVSQGMNAGAHDGRSPLEVAFNEFANGTRPGRVVVKSAGNERNKAGHARVSIGQDAAEELRWRRPQGSVWLKERVELWWNSENELEFRLQAPSGQSSEWVTLSRPVVSGALGPGGIFRMELTPNHVDNGDSQLRIELGDGIAGIASGAWRLEILGRAVPGDGTIDAWIERSEAQPTYFETHANEEMTLSIPGTAQNVITVGAVGPTMPLTVGAFSSYGPTRDKRRKPDVAAPGVAIEAARGGDPQSAFPQDGTSMAAPHVTGALALVLSRAAKSGRPIPTATQLAAVLRHRTANYNSRWHPGQGYGLIDVTKLLAAFSRS